MNTLFKYILFFLSSITMSFGQAKIDSLKNELIQAQEDTLKITILIDLAYSSDSLPDQIMYARQAHQIGLNVTSIKHKSRSELVYGLFYGDIDLDSGMTLMESGAQRYLANELFDYATNAYYIKGINYEILNKFDSALAAYTKTFEIASEHDLNSDVGDAASALANINNLRGKNAEALKWALQAKEAYERAEKPIFISDVLNQIGIIYDQKGLYSEALDNYLTARDIAIEHEDVDAEILINNNIGVIYDNMNNSEMALNYYSDALEKAKIHGLEDSEATLLNNLSYIHLKRGDTSKAVMLLKQSLAIDLSVIYPCFESYPLEGLGAIYIAQNKLDSAELLLDKALNRGKECEDVGVLTSVYKDLGILYGKQGKYQLAKEALNKSLRISLNSGMIVERKEALNELYKFHAKYGEDKIAMGYLQKYSSLSDSITKVNSVEKAAELAASYEFRKQVDKINQERMDSEKKLTEEIELKSKENRLILLAMILFFLLAISLTRSFFYIRKKNRRLKWLDHEKNKLIGMVAHDLRNPLNMIVGLIPLFQDSVSKKEDKELEKYVELLNASGERMRNMIDRVLDISEIENMKVNLKTKRTDLSKLTYESIHNFDVIASQKGISIVDDIDESTSRFANVDPSYLVQVIDNLLSNAIKFSEKGKKIEVSVNTEDDKHIIKVMDQGPGIKEEEQKKLFQAYTRLSSKPTGQERSTGLGLSIAKKFLDAMDAEITCDSKLGEGTTFKILFQKAS